LIIILLFLLLSVSPYYKLGALLLDIAIMIWATLKVEGFYQKPDKKRQALRLSIIGGLAFLVLVIYIPT